MTYKDLLTELEKLSPEMLDKEIKFSQGFNDKGNAKFYPTALWISIWEELDQPVIQYSFDKKMVQRIHDPIQVQRDRDDD